MTYKTQKLPKFRITSKTSELIESKLDGHLVTAVQSLLDKQSETIEGLTTVVEEETGFIVPSIFDFQVTRHNQGIKDSSSTAKGLRLYFDFINGMPGLDWDIGSPRKEERPTYQFSKFLENQYEAGNIAGSTASNYFSAVTMFYKHHLKFSYPFRGGVPIEFDQFVIKKFDNDLTSHITGLEIKLDVADCKPRISSESRRELKPLEKSHQQEFFGLFEYKGSNELLLMCLLAIHSGMRASEIADCRVDMISGYAGSANFLLQLGPPSGHKSKKNNSMSVKVSGRIIAILLQHIKSKRYLERLAKSDSNRPHVFLNKNGKPYHQKMISTLFGEFVRKYVQQILPQFDHKFHDLRATFGVTTMRACLDSGWSRSESLTFTKQQMRHKNIGDTLRYLEYWESNVALKKQALINEEILEAVFKRLEEA